MRPSKDGTFSLFILAVSWLKIMFRSFPTVRLWIVIGSCGFALSSAAQMPIPVDLDGDGFTDIVFWQPSDNSWEALMTYPGADDFTLRVPQHIGGAAPTGDQILVGDLNGDKMADIFTWRKSDHSWVVNLATINYPLSQPPSAPTFTSAVWPGVAGADGPFYVGDFTGDGKSDIAVWDNTSKTWLVYVSTGTSFKVEHWPGAWGSDGPVFVADLNGDGKADVFMWRDSTKSWTVNISTGKGFRAEEWKGAWGSDGPIHIGDLNGDKKADVFMWRDSTKTWTVNLSNGHGFDQEEWHGTWGTDGPNFVGDFDGNGIADVAIFRQSDGAWFINFSTKTGFISRQVAAPPINGVALMGKFFNKKRDTIAVQQAAGAAYSLYTFANENQTWPTPQPAILAFGVPTTTIPYGGTAALTYKVAPTSGCSNTITGEIFMGLNFSDQGKFTVPASGEGTVGTPALEGNPSYAEIAFSCVDYGQPANTPQLPIAVGAKPVPVPVTSPYASLSIIFVLSSNPYGGAGQAVLNMSGYRTVNGVKQTGANDTFAFAAPPAQLDNSVSPTLYGGGNLTQAGQLNPGTWTVSASVTGLANPQTCDVMLVAGQAYALTIMPGADISAEQKVCSLGAL